MWEKLELVDWGRLTHAYGWAHDVPRALRHMVSYDEAERHAGWDTFWGALNHQGDFYDSTVAVVPFLIEACLNADVPVRDEILRAFRSRWDDAPDYGGDALVPNPPGGVDEPTPMLDLGAGDAALQVGDKPPADEEEFDTERYRRMDLAAWQTGRAIMTGRPYFHRLLDDPSAKTATAAAVLLLVWRSDRAAAKRALVRLIDSDDDPLECARRILELGVYGDADDAGALARWVAGDRPPEVRAAAALAWAWIAEPGPVPAAASAALVETSAPDCRAFATLPWEGMYRRGPWILPQNAADVVLRLADNQDDELRWRAVQGLELSRVTASYLAPERAIPLLVRKLTDRGPQVRASASTALAERGWTALDFDPNLVPALIERLRDDDAKSCASAARALGAVSSRLTPTQRRQAISLVDGARRRFGNVQETIFFGHSGLGASRVLKLASDELGKASEAGLLELLAEFFQQDISRGERRMPMAECERLIAHGYDFDPNDFIATAIKALKGANRSAALGAALWLMKLGPGAARALEALDAAATGGRDQYANTRIGDAARFIREAISAPAGPGLPQSAGGSRGEVGNGSAPEFAVRLSSADVIVRADAARRLAESPPAAAAARSNALCALLLDNEDATVSIAERIVVRGRVHYWRRERRSPRAWAIRALLPTPKPPLGNALLSAMLLEAVRPAVHYAGLNPEPERFSIDEWRAAALLSGDLYGAEVAIRVVQQECMRCIYAPEDEPNTPVVYGASSELAKIARRIAGRLD